jgi:predicted exporter
MNTITVWLVVLILTPLFVSYLVWAWSLKGATVRMTVLRRFAGVKSKFARLPWRSILTVTIPTVFTVIIISVAHRFEGLRVYLLWTIVIVFILNASFIAYSLRKRRK